MIFQKILDDCELVRDVQEIILSYVMILNEYDVNFFEIEEFPIEWTTIKKISNQLANENIVYRIGLDDCYMYNICIFFPAKFIRYENTKLVFKITDTETVNRFINWKHRFIKHSVFHWKQVHHYLIWSLPLHGGHTKNTTLKNSSDIIVYFDISKFNVTCFLADGD